MEKGVKLCDSMISHEMEPIPLNSNPFLHDNYHMGTQIGTNCFIMFEKHSNEKQKYVIICNPETGKRVRIELL